MPNTRALDLLVERAKELLEEAGIRLANTIKSEQQAREMVELLQQYRGEYIKEMQRLMQAGMDSMSLANYRTFIISLDNNIAKAKETLESQEKQVAASQNNWLAQHMKHNSFQTLIERRERESNLKQSRSEQRLLDEMSSQMRLRASNKFDEQTPGL